jgi:hypothetical protein
VLITVGVALLAVGIPPGGVRPPPSDPPPDGDTGTGGDADVTLVAAVAEGFVEPAATASAGAAIVPTRIARQVAARARPDDRPTVTSTHP